MAGGDRPAVADVVSAVAAANDDWTRSTSATPAVVAPAIVSPDATTPSAAAPATSSEDAKGADCGCEQRLIPAGIIDDRCSDAGSIAGTASDGQAIGINNTGGEGETANSGTA
jgi:hypothetical protein